MRLPIVSLALIGAALSGQIHTAAAQSAYSYPICAVYPGKSDSRSCYYSSYAQCMATMSGIGGYCIDSPYYQPGAPPPRRPSRRHRSGAH
jgi:hypothetical protein